VKRDRPLSRRDFLKTTGRKLAAFGVGMAAAGGITRSVAWAQDRGKVPPSERIYTGHIGIGGMGGGHLGGFIGNPQTDVVAVCEVHQGRLADAKKRVEDAGGKADAYTDFRRVIERPDIDAVVIATPDHWHTLTTIMACEAGKDVYCEKPMTLTIEEGRKMIQAARRYNRIVQIGTQQRADEHFRHVVEQLRSGRIGKITLTRTWFGGGSGGGWPPDGEPPADIDWDMWLGPAPWVPFNPARFGNFRMFWDYSGGELTDWGTHLIDIIHWGTGEDTPLEIEAKGRYANDGIYDMPETLEVTYKYPSHTMIWSQPPPEPLPLGRPGHGMYFEGAKGRCFVDRGGYIFDPPELDQPLGPNDFHLPRVPGHGGEWLECIKTRQLPTSDVAVGHRSTSAPHLGNIAFRLGRKLRWDGEKEQFIGDEVANRFVGKPYRPPWHL